MKRIGFTLIILFSAAFNWAQGSGLITDILDPSFSNSDLRYKKLFKEVIGSPYLYEEWTDGYIKILSGAMFIDLKIKFDTYSNNLIINHQENEVLINKWMVDVFAVMDPETNQIREFKLIKLADRKDNQLCEILYEGKISAYRLIESIVTESSNYSGGYGTEKQKHSKFIQSFNYYLLLSAGQTLEIRLNKSSILKILGSKQSELNAYIKKNKLKFKDPLDLVKLLRYYESLI